MKRYLPVHVLSSPLGDCTLSGVSFTHPQQLLVPCPEGHITDHDVEEAKERGLLYIVLEIGHAGGRMHFRPPNPEGKWFMFGGNFVYTSDSRFSALYGGQPIHVHDRCEQ